MRILVDGRPFVRSAAGISTFLRCSLLSLSNLYPNDQIYLFLPKKNNITAVVDFPPNVNIIKLNNRITNKFPNLLLLLLYIPYLVRRYKIDLYYSPVPCIPYLLPKNVKTLIVIHDVVNIEYSQTTTLRNKIANYLLLKRSINIADYLWANSNYTANKVKQYFPKRKQKNIYVGCSIDTSIYKKRKIIEDEFVKLQNKWHIPNQYYLFVGSLEPRKNLEYLLQEIVPQVYCTYKIPLIVVGARGWKDSKIFKIINTTSYPKESVIFTGFISNGELSILYNRAQFFISTSLNEGFGMPQLESLYCGCPIITSHNSAMIEVADGIQGAYTVHGFKKQDWIKTIDDVLCKKPIVDRTRLVKYNWDFIVANLRDKIIL